MEKDYCALFAAHHRRLIGTIGDLGERAKEDTLHTPELLTYLWEQLVPHAQGEEVTLYRRAETLPGGSAIVRPMVSEHKVIVQHIHDLERLFATQYAMPLQQLIQAVLALIHLHFRKEELMPLLRRHLSSAEFGSLIEAAHQVGREAKTSDIKHFMDIDHRRVDRMLEAFS